MYNLNARLIPYLKEHYPKGSRIRLLNMQDVRSISPGTEGTVSGVDDMGTIHVHWDNGRMLGVIYGVDEFVAV